MTVSGRDVLTRPSETIRARYKWHNLNENSPVKRLISRCNRRARSTLGQFVENIHLIFALFFNPIF